VPGKNPLADESVFAEFVKHLKTVSVSGGEQTDLKNRFIATQILLDSGMPFTDAKERGLRGATETSLAAFIAEVRGKRLPLVDRKAFDEFVPHLESVYLSEESSRALQMRFLLVRNEVYGLSVPMSFPDAMDRHLGSSALIYALPEQVVISWFTSRSRSSRTREELVNEFIEEVRGKRPLLMDKAEFTEFVECLKGRLVSAKAPKVFNTQVLSVQEELQKLWFSDRSRSTRTREELVNEFIEEVRGKRPLLMYKAEFTEFVECLKGMLVSAKTPKVFNTQFLSVQKELQKLWFSEAIERHLGSAALTGTLSNDSLASWFGDRPVGTREVLLDEFVKRVGDDSNRSFLAYKTERTVFAELAEHLKAISGPVWMPAPMFETLRKQFLFAQSDLQKPRFSDDMGHRLELAVSAEALSADNVALWFASRERSPGTKGEMIRELVAEVGIFEVLTTRFLSVQSSLQFSDAVEQHLGSAALAEALSDETVALWFTSRGRPSGTREDLLKEFIAEIKNKRPLLMYRAEFTKFIEHLKRVVVPARIFETLKSRFLSAQSDLQNLRIFGAEESRLGSAALSGSLSVEEVTLWFTSRARQVGNKETVIKEFFAEVKVFDELKTRLLFVQEELPKLCFSKAVEHRLGSAALTEALSDESLVRWFKDRPIGTREVLLGEFVKRVGEDSGCSFLAYRTEMAVFTELVKRLKAMSVPFWMPVPMFETLRKQFLFAQSDLQYLWFAEAIEHLRPEALTEALSDDIVARWFASRGRPSGTREELLTEFIAEIKAS
jgi:hypothetical protein